MPLRLLKGIGQGHDLVAHAVGSAAAGRVRMCSQQEDPYAEAGERWGKGHDGSIRPVEVLEVRERREGVGWLSVLVDVGVHACQVLNATGKVIFMTPDELSSDRDFVERAEDDGYRVVVVPLSIRLRLQGATDITGAPIVDLGQFKGVWNASFSFSFIDPSKLTKAERAVFDQTDAIMNLRGGRPDQVKEILISKTMRVGATGFGEAPGVWDEAEGRIIIKRDQLRSLSRYAGTLLHEVVHAATRTADISAEFENALSDEIGDVVSNAFQT